ncbi:hypothetical protein FB561_6579 [Kribbella amoyensis]|uniref:Uncharacterized protein n=1 Tax=Kribbella amoyensis TaxID=996641 RepID=A0A561B857_9ACTN|nr:hypothetical protein [Kribbella amoyensis]TWD75141.1 hypothetical protein FB561_6579 [Kribbella amoyensis]
MKHGKRFAAGELTPFALWGGGGYHQEVVGVPVDCFERSIDTSAVLLPDVVDPVVVAVQVRGMTVGHLPGEVVELYRDCFAELAERGQVAQVPCRIRVEDSRVRVRIALGPPHLCLPLNQRPPVPYLQLPDGPAIQVTGEDECMAAIDPFLGGAGEGHVYATLHEAAVDLVEIRVDGHRVGQLTDRASGDLLPAIRHLEPHGLTAVATAKIRGNHLRAEITLYCATADQLPADWIAAADALVPLAPLAGLGFASIGVVPRKPGITFVPAPGWPPAPIGWEPPPGWLPDPEWPPAPPDWKFWALDQS